MNNILIIIQLVLFVFILLFLISLYFYQVAFIRTNRPVMESSITAPTNVLIDEFENFFKCLRHLTVDNIQLAAWYVPAKENTNKVVILVHGYRGNKSTMKSYAAVFHKMGYNILMPDNRAAGDSQGRFISYGFYDKQDVIAWANSLLDENPDTTITLFGHSMGGATVMLAAGQSNLPNNVKNIVEDCGYDSLWNELSYQLKHKYHIYAFPILFFVSGINKFRQGWWIKEVSPLKSLVHNNRPILFIHGGEDNFVPVNMVYRNYEAVQKNVSKELLVVCGAGHTESLQTDPDSYIDTLRHFMNRYH